jgi:hypothetical protein
MGLGCMGRSWADVWLNKKEIKIDWEMGCNDTWPERRIGTVKKFSKF